MIYVCLSLTQIWLIGWSLQPWPFLHFLFFSLAYVRIHIPCQCFRQHPFYHFTFFQPDTEPENPEEARVREKQSNRCTYTPFSFYLFFSSYLILSVIFCICSLLSSSFHLQNLDLFRFEWHTLFSLFSSSSFFLVSLDVLNAFCGECGVLILCVIFQALLSCFSFYH